MKIKIYRYQMILFLFFFFSCGVLEACGKKEAVFVAGEERISDFVVQSDQDESAEEVSAEPFTESLKVVVYVCGQVKVPGVYELDAGSRIGDAIALAGGMTTEAFKDSLNLAQILVDAQMIRVPSIDEKDDSLGGTIRGTDEAGRISLNAASKEQLMTLPGVGESKADAILAYREEHGGFGAIEEIMRIPGIKEGIFAKIRDRITL